MIDPRLLLPDAQPARFARKRKDAEKPASGFPALFVSAVFDGRGCAPGGTPSPHQAHPKNNADNAFTLPATLLLYYIPAEKSSSLL